MDLDGVATAHCDVGLDISFQISEFTAGARAAVRITRNGDGLKATRPYVAGDKAAVKSIISARENFYRFGGFQRRNQLDDRSENADRVTGFFCAG